ncbi:MAG: hypothetical protein ACUVTW_01310 [Thermogutta sp.]
MLARGVEFERLSCNPSAVLKTTPANPAEKKTYFLADVIEKAIEYCSSFWWRLLLTLPRYQGLRTPRESLPLRWEHVLWG